MIASRLHLVSISLVVAASAALWLAGCDSGDDGHTPADQTLSLALSWDKAPPTTGQNRLVVKVTDSAGEPVTGASVDIALMMPAMGHGSSEAAVITELGLGEYEAFPVTFQMPGEWSIAVSAGHGERHGTKTMSMNIGGAMGGM